MGRGGHGVAVSDMNATPHPSLSRAASLTGHAHVCVFNNKITRHGFK